MTISSARGGLNRIIRTTAVVTLFVVLTVGLMLWLMGYFHPKVGGVPISAVPERLVGQTSLAVVRLIRVPASETAVGSVRAVHSTSVASKILAKVVQARITAGQPVKRGDLLVQLDDADLKARRQQASAAVDGARAARDQAKIEFDRIKQLYDRHSASQIEFDRAVTALKSTEAEVQRSEEALKEAATIMAFSTIRSPIDGVVVDKKVDAGDMVTPGQVLVTLYDPKHMQLVASVREALTRRLKVGNTIQVGVDALGMICDGEVSEIVPEAESASRSFLVKVTGPCPPGVYAGMFGRLIIPLDEEELLVIPSDAVRRVGQLDLVDVAEGKYLRRRAVQLGRTLDDQVQVLSGLRQGEQVAVAVPQTREGP